MTRTFYVPEDRRPPGRGSCDDTRRSTWHHIRWAGVGTGPGPRPRPHSSRVSGPGRSRTGTCQVGRPLAAAPGAPSPGDRSRNRFRRSDASYLPSFHFSTIFTASSSIDERSTPRTTSLLARKEPRAGPSSLFTAPHRLHHPPRPGSPELTRAQRGPGWMMDRVRQGRTVSPPSGQLSRAFFSRPRLSRIDNLSEVYVFLFFWIGGLFEQGSEFYSSFFEQRFNYVQMNTCDNRGLKLRFDILEDRERNSIKDWIKILK